MSDHFGEVLVLVAVCMVVGCFVGALIYGHVASTRYAASQEAVAAKVDAVVGTVSRKMGGIFGRVIPVKSPPPSGR